MFVSKSECVVSVYERVCFCGIGGWRRIEGEWDCD